MNHKAHKGHKVTGREEENLFVLFVFFVVPGLRSLGAS